MGARSTDSRRRMAGNSIPKSIELWKPVVGYEGYYEVSSEGRVRSVTRTIHFADGRVRTFKGRLLKQKKHRYGYPLVTLCRGMANKKWRLVHVLVMRAFKGPCPPGLEVCHNELGCSPKLSGLRYDTRKNNFADKHRHGTYVCGIKHHSAHILPRQVRSIQKATGTISNIAARFGVSRTHAWNVRNGKRRSHG